MIKLYRLKKKRMSVHRGYFVLDKKLKYEGWSKSNAHKKPKSQKMIQHTWNRF